MACYCNVWFAEGEWLAVTCSLPPFLHIRVSKRPCRCQDTLKSKEWCFQEKKWRLLLSPCIYIYMDVNVDV